LDARAQLARYIVLAGRCCGAELEVANVKDSGQIFASQDAPGAVQIAFLRPRIESPRQLGGCGFQRRKGAFSGRELGR